MSRYLVFATVSLALLVTAVGATAIAVAFPEITAYFNVSIVLAGWVLSAGILSGVATVPIAGKASDALGRKRTFMFLLVVFIVGTFLCAIAPNIYLLILFRLVQGIGAGSIFAACTSIAAETFPETRQRYVSLVISMSLVGMLLGPSVGGWLTESFGWRYIFWFLIPWGVLTLVAAAFLMKPDREVQKVSLDLRGAVLFATSLSAMMVGITIIGDGRGKTVWLAGVGMLALGAGLLFGYLKQEKRVTNPLVDPEVLVRRPFLAANIFNLIYGMVGGVITLIPLYAVTIYGMSTLQSGLALTPRTAGAMITSVVSSFLLVRWGYRKPLLVGSSVMILSFLLLSLEAPRMTVMGASISGVTIMLIVVAASGLGGGVTMPAASNACIELWPERVGMIAGVASTCRNAGAAFGVAMASVVLGMSGSFSRGFYFVFIGSAVAMAVGAIVVFALPRSPADISQRVVVTERGLKPKDPI
ncbi:MAG: MFS transporter [Chloroflexi bacterium]|nr:MFS transporter [Chloroflexota bacterium]